MDSMNTYYIFLYCARSIVFTNNALQFITMLINVENHRSFTFRFPILNACTLHLSSHSLWRHVRVVALATKRSMRRCFSFFKKQVPELEQCPPIGWANACLFENNEWSMFAIAKEKRRNTGDVTRWPTIELHDTGWPTCRQGPCRQAPVEDASALGSADSGEAEWTSCPHFQFLSSAKIVASWHLALAETRRYLSVRVRWSPCNI